MPQTKINSFFKPTPRTAPRPSTSTTAGSDATPARPPLQGRSLFQPSPAVSSTPRPAETTAGNAAPLTSDGAMTNSQSASVSNCPAGSQSAPKAKPRKPGTPRGLGSTTRGRKRKHGASKENSGNIRNKVILQEITNKRSRKDSEPPTPNHVPEEGDQSTVTASCPLSPITPTETNGNNTQPTAQSTASVSGGVTTPAESLLAEQSRELENGGSLQVTGNKRDKGKEDEPSTSTQMPVKKEKESTGDVSFRLKFDLTELKQDFRITARGDQPILHALQADTRLDKIKKKLSKIYLDPYHGENNPIRGVPNMGSPCRVIEGGRFEAKLGKDESGNMTLYSDVELKLSERSKIYLDLKDRPSNTPWLAKKNTTMFQSPILVDCLPGDTFVTALLRDGRIDKKRVRYTSLICRGSTGEVNIKLTDKSAVNHGKTFTCKVLKTAQVSDEEWEKAHDRSCQANSPDVAMSDTTTGNGAPDIQAEATSGPDTGNKSLQTEWITQLVEMLIRRSQALVANLLDLDFEQKESSNAENRRKRKLDQFAKFYRQDFYNANNEETSFLLMEQCCEFGCSVGVLASDACRLATCFRLGSKYVLTNKHVSQEMAERGGASAFFVIFNYKKLSDLDCNDQFVSDDSLIKFRVNRVVCSCQNDDLDYSLLELDVPDDQSDKLPPGLGHLIKETRDKTTVTIVGHPGVRPKKIDPSCPVVGPDHSIAVYLRFHPDPMVNNPNRDNYESVFAHGSSGSPGFDDEGNLVVMHACGYHLYDGSKTEVQQGVKMVAIREDLKQRDDLKRRDDLPADFLEDLFPPPSEPMETD
ncbi:uncharacterized protein [Branchiostoma lanceolatum]|uniref:uncharacterized protein isoform X1 n=1 Tax=Branchiostoma lanceolatum TaxID=7740 RepID=UPI00345147DF